MAVSDDIGKLKILEMDRVGEAIEILRSDSVVMLKNVPSACADNLIKRVAAALNLTSELETQAGLAALRGHRRRVGQYFMTTNFRSDYQFVTPHSEGDDVSNMQLAAFFCFENSTDGGETILMNIDSAAAGWNSLRQLVVKVPAGRLPLTKGEAARARSLYHLRSRYDVVRQDDNVLGYLETEIPDVSLASVLEKPKRIYSPFLERELFVLWDNIAGIDRDLPVSFVNYLRQSSLLKTPPYECELEQLDNVARRRIWSSGVSYDGLFKCRMILKMRAGDFVVANNLTWAHAVSNWTPGSGIRNIVAAFA